ncbi:DUF1381 domain-containing protein [Staphylococcus succinus]|uniref:DUF1381 domain-containing protein n=1 Tax=Staphylococcus succinus TaxID=61015 RepID=UPI00301DF0D5
MTQYLIQEFTDSTGYTFTHVVKASDNERYTVVNADSESEALAIAKQPRGLLDFVQSNFNTGGKYINE